jgi:hypothetical protein
MRLFPVDARTLVFIAAATAIPVAPLLLTMVSASELFDQLLQLLF